ncbi:RING finger protein 214 isoform X2 [Chanos chanos]|nr:RING finger protein 214 isoform X2 [Chanos chanos]
MDSNINSQWSVTLEEGTEDENLVGETCQSGDVIYTYEWPVMYDPWNMESTLPAGLLDKADDELVESEDYSTAKTIVETQERDVQTDACTEERGVNTSEDWESNMRSVEEYSAVLALQYEALVKQQQAEEAEHGFHVDNLEKKKEEKKHQHQGLIDKIESLHVKLELNSSKTTRKNFMAKRQELTAEKERMEEERKRLAQELEDSDRKLKMLTEEQNQDKLTWEQEIASLRNEMERLHRQADEANHTALKDEIGALETERDVCVSLVEDWIEDAERYLDTLRLDPSQQHLQQQLEWEKNITVIRSSLSVLQNKFNENLQLLHKGHPLDSLPSVSPPSLPHVPTLELLMSPIVQSVPNPFHQDHTLPPASVATPLHQLQQITGDSHRVTPPLTVPSPQNLPTSAAHPGLLTHGILMSNAHIPVLMPSSAIATAHTPVAPHIGMVPTQSSTGAPHFAKAVPNQPVTPASHSGSPSPNTHVPATHIPVQGSHSNLPATFVGTAASHPSNQPAQGLVRAPHPAVHQTIPPNVSPQPLPSNPPPAGKLDKLLERLGASFPQCTRDQLTEILQQIKAARGTMAGMSVDDLTQQVALRLAQNERAPLGPIGPPSGARAFPSGAVPVQQPAGQFQRAVRPHLRPPVAQVFHTRPPQATAPSNYKLCLMCQNYVEPGSQYNTNCSHTLHKDCISVWLQSSKKNSCPFCPSK